MAKFLEGRQSRRGGCGRGLKERETWPLSGCNVLPSRIWSYVERKREKEREEGRRKEQEENTRAERRVTVSVAVFIEREEEEEEEARGRNSKDSSNRSLSTNHRRVELSRS